MAAEEREDQLAPEAAAATADAGRSLAPAVRKQQGSSSRQYLGSFGKEVDGERLIQLRKENAEFRLEGRREEERRKQRDREMAEAYKQRQAELAAKVKQDRRRQLARLEVQKERSQMLSKEMSLTLSDREEDIMDDEYRMLLEKYGDKLRMPRIPPLSWKQRSVMSSESARSRDRQLKPQVPKQRVVAPAAKASGMRIGGVLASSASTVGADKKKAPGLAAPGAPGPAGGTAALPALKAAKPGAAAPGAVDAAAAPAEAEDEIPESHRSVMPKKEALRKFQQSLIKKTEVSFYKSHMKKHFRRILEATEVTFNDTAAKRIQASCNLAKPLSVAEIKQLSSVSVRNP
jgi:hypothetical protein